MFGRLVGKGEIVALLRFSGGGEDGFGEKAGLDQILRKRSTPGGSFLFIFVPGTTGQVAANDAFDREGLGGAAASEPAGVDFGGGDAGGHVETEDVVRPRLGQGLKPVTGDGGKKSAFAGYRLGENDVEGGDAIGGDEPSFLLPAIDIADLTRTEKSWGIGHSIDDGNFFLAVN